MLRTEVHAGIDGIISGLSKLIVRLTKPAAVVQEACIERPIPDGSIQDIVEAHIGRPSRRVRQSMAFRRREERIAAAVSTIQKTRCMWNGNL